MNDKDTEKIIDKEAGTDSSGELLKELVANSKKQLFYSRIAAFAALAAAAVLIICLIRIVPPVLKTVNQVNDIMVQVSETIELADTAIENVTQMSLAITDMGNNMDTFITENAESVEQIMQKLDQIDFEGLNSAIKDLGDVVEPLANFFGRFR